jgi:transposase
MAQNFMACDREQELLLPPSVREWLAEDQFAWLVIDAVGQLDLVASYAAYRADGWGRAAHDPAMMVALLVYAYAIGERSSRRIERRCVEDVATRVICSNQAPDQTTIARFRQRHETALGELFGEVLAVCAEGRGWSTSNCSRSTARRCTPTLRSMPCVTTTRLRARSSRTPAASMLRRTSASATPAVKLYRYTTAPQAA